MSEFLTIDPEVEAILREVAADPRSSLLRVTRPQRVKGLFERYPRVSPTQAGLSAAERHLLQVHRAEVAWLLKEICKHRLANDERSRLFLSRGGVEILDGSSISTRVALERERSPSTISVPELDELLARCAADPMNSALPTTSLAVASLRLEPNDSSRVCIGLALTFDGGSRTALDVYRHIINEDPHPLVASVTWDNAGLAYYSLGARHHAMHAYAKSAMIMKDRSTPFLEWVLASYRIGSEPHLLEACSLMDTCVPDDDETVAHLLAMKRQRRILGEWSLEHRNSTLVRRLRDRMKGAARRVLDELA